MFAARGTRGAAPAASFGEGDGATEESFKLAVEVGLATGTPFAQGWHGASPVLPRNLPSGKDWGAEMNAISGEG